MKRIKQHAFNSSPGTYGLHLYRNGKNWQEKIHASYFYLPKEGMTLLAGSNTKDKYLQQLILTFIESRIREEFSPMIGKQ